MREVRVSAEGSDEAVLRETMRACTHLANIDEILVGMESQGRRTRSFRNALPRWQSWILAYPHSWVHAVGTVDTFDSDHDLDVLENLADALDQIVPTYTEQGLTRVSKVLEGASAALDADGSLPTNLRRHITSLLKHAQQCMDEYDLVGDFELQKAVDRLIVAINAAASASSSMSSAWETLREDMVWPVFEGLALEAGSRGPSLGAITSLK